ncbi:MAG: DM13 domain-containing protein [Candidatus Pacebacteria bacterium]|nr:DM13 domain-containing protein [Candidatus Paceibacterota bacterium]MBP9772480.1 DM13 domain-containing protein [Candidatus Paceibacterota bacterium]
MKKIILLVLVIVVIFLVYWFISPLFIDKKVSEDLPAVQITNEGVVSEETTPVESVSQSLEIKTGTFSGFDRLHTGSGTAKVISIDGKNYIRFEEDFSVTNGPDLYVGLGENGEYIKGSELEKLKGNIGSQNYELPEGVDPENIKEVWVWCKAFSVPFAKAVFY